MTRRPVVPDDEVAAGPVPDLRGWLGRSGALVTSPARRCLQPGVPVDARLRPWDLGDWTGRPFDELDVATWRSDPGFDAHGGESLVALHARVAELLTAWHERPGRLAAVTHAAVIKAVVVHALGAPLQAVWDVDVRPASVTEVHASSTGWRLTRLSCRSP